MYLKSQVIVHSVLKKILLERLRVPDDDSDNAKYL